MSWLSVIKNNIVAVLSQAVPTPQQATVHSAASDLASAMGTFLVTLQGIAEQGIKDLVQTHLGSAAAELEYEFLHQLILAAEGRKAEIAKPTPTPVVPPSA